MIPGFLVVVMCAQPAGDSLGPLLTPELRTGVDRGLGFLVEKQNRDGSFGIDSRDRDTHIGVTALAGIALLAGGYVPGSGPFGVESRRTIQSVVGALDAKTGLIATERTLSQPMYSHAFATLYLAEAYGMTGEEDLGPPLRRAVDLIVSSQNAEGGWRYYPGSRDADLSVTACQIAALRAARNAGVAVPIDVIERAASYVIRCRNDDGSFRYQVDRGHSSFHLTVAALTALYGLGLGERPEVEAAFGFLAPYFPAGQKRLSGHFLYGQYYAMQAAYLHGGDTFPIWYVRVRDRLLGLQRKDGAFDEPAVGDLYGTAMALIILQIPDHFLPILTR
ncbi:MAG: terpene cyclase/mutase family protein [Planctomycetes bacterium]|nr:terpene cyclase/mutase family protein [Planctomycetota bacterium]MBI3845604.1 terpene cyclase/mutase family protein [Planctomycetota bacterium]